MRIIGDVSQEEMNERFPGPMAGLAAVMGGGDAGYCGGPSGPYDPGACDGIRAMVTDEDGVRRCASCGTPHPKETA